MIAESPTPPHPNTTTYSPACDAPAGVQCVVRGAEPAAEPGRLGEPHGVGQRDEVDVGVRDDQLSAYEPGSVNPGCCWRGAHLGGAGEALGARPAGEDERAR